MEDNIINKKLTDHVASILKLSLEDASQWIENNKVIRKYIKSASIKSSSNEPINSSNADMIDVTEVEDKTRTRSIFMLDGESVRLETVFHLWFDRTGNNKKKETIERYLQGKTKARKGLKGYLKSASASIEDLDTFVLLFNLLLSDKKLAINGGLE